MSTRDTPADDAGRTAISEDWAATVLGLGPASPERAGTLPWAASGVLVVLVLGAATRFLDRSVPVWFDGSGLAKAVEFPVYAIALGVVVVALTAWFAFRVERRPDASRPGLGGLWRRFPKFVLGFVAASVITTWWISTVSAAEGKAVVGVANDLRTWFLILAFVSIGLEFRVSSLREAGWRPVAVFASATVVNVLVALGLAVVLFSGFSA
ncbi:putative sulfate exporter family transporter [Nonomuraea sp. SMC257]|uniref:Putative sulfate exporter family transporter n=1 Tax=Nonomuraea montanisoli TaxID=2741721 RepID=A0A7Y6I8F6_9ACTN|nr:putative sulfate exporter family transporter [Nonomuraea montanisoli]NUW32680.1 putative sulfate exporter family transporter [Nonomuraea montanisoli]